MFKYLFLKISNNFAQFCKEININNHVIKLKDNYIFFYYSIFHHIYAYIAIAKLNT